MKANKPKTIPLLALVSIEDNYHFAFPSLGSFIDTLVPLAFSIASMMLVFYFLIATLELITSQGDKAHIVSARSKIYHAIIGFVLLGVLFLLMQYLLPQLGVVGLEIF